MILLINLITIIKKYFYYHFLQIHIYIMYWTREASRYTSTKYELFLEKVRDLEWYISFYPIFKFIFSRVYEIYIIIKPKYGKDSSSFTQDMAKYLGYSEIQRYSHIYLFIYCLLFDIIYNNMVLNVVYYYGILYCFYYYLLVATTRFSTIFSKIGCLKIADYLIRKKEKEQGKVIILPEDMYYYVDTIEPYYHDQLAIAFKDKYHDYGIGKIYMENEFFISNIFMICTLYFYNINIFLNIWGGLIQMQIPIQNLLQIILLILITSWLYFWKAFFKYLFIILTILLIISWLIINIYYFVPLLYNETLVCATFEKFNMQIKILINYTVADKMYFITEYTIYHLSQLNISHDEYLPIIVEKISYKNILELLNIDDLKLYIDTFIKNIKIRK